ncbi:amino acid adenylation domain-containing protein [Myxococcus faecalis]|uniref:amino acid adenylation domain-containing protein n=1 Tax=Myxococcus faecalis TaxID=3115646 RepID=UPI003CF3229A
MSAPALAQLSPDERRALLARTLRDKGSRPEPPLSYAQARLWFLDRFQPGNPTYNLPAVTRLTGPIDLAVLQRCLDALVQRHESLRTLFALVRGEPVQRVLPALELKLSAVRPSGEDEATRAVEAQRLAMEECRRPFDLERGPLLRMTLYSSSDTEHLLVLVLHHIIADGWSMRVLFDELARLYEAFSAGRPSPLPALPLQYVDFAAWQRKTLRGEVLEGHLAYWRKQLASVPSLLALPTHGPRPRVVGQRGGHHVFSLEPALMERLGVLGRREGATSFMLLLSAFATLLHRLSGETDVCIGTPIANRMRPELEGLVGFFANTLVLRADLSGTPSFRQLLGRVREMTLGAFAHQDLPFEKLVEELRPERNLGHNPLFQVMFVLQNTGPRDASRAPSSDTPPLYSSGTAKFDLTLCVTEAEAGAHAFFEYNLDLFEGEMIARLANSLHALLWGIAEEPDRTTASLPLLDAEARRRVEAAQPLPEVPVRSSVERVHEKVSARAMRHPEAVAVQTGEDALSYGELVHRADLVARALRTQGVSPGMLVGLFVEPSPELVVAQLGVLCAGGAFIPLDTSEPPSRLAATVEALRPSHILCQQHQAARLQGLPGRHILLEHCLSADAPPTGDMAPLAAGTRSAGFAPAKEDEPIPTIRDGFARSLPRPGPAAPPAATLDGLACALPRPGPEGRPLGVVMSHAALAAACRLPDLRLSPDDCLSFPEGAWDEAAPFLLLGALAAGARLAPLSGGRSLTPRKLAMHLREHSVSVIALTTPMLVKLGREFPWSLRSLRLVLWTGGPDEEALLTSSLPPDVLSRVLHVYGWTEVGGIAALRPVAAPSPSERPVTRIGTPVAGTTLHLLDEALSPVPSGFVGDLYISGEQLASGYLSSPERTFPRDNLVRTGDLARRLPDGGLEWVGRRDGRHLHRGTRLELGEVEQALRAHPQVTEATVVLRPGSQLVAAVVAPSSERKALRQHLEDRLPDSALPDSFLFLDALPRAPTEEHARRALLTELERRDTAGASAAPYSAPRDPVEETLARIWAQAFSLERVGIHDDFFRLGGHSLLATQVVARACDAFGVDLPLRQLFEAPTIAQLARTIERLGHDSGRPPPIRPAPRDRPLPLSFAQQRLWFLDQFEPNSAFYNIPTSFRIRAPLDVAALQGSLNALVLRHESLRTTFTVMDQQPVQVIAPPGSVALPVVDLRSWPEATREHEAQRLAALEAQHPFDLSRGPLLRARLLHLADNDYVLLLTVHHIVADAWSADVLFRELSVLYEAGRTGTPASLPPLELQYADFAAWQRQWLTGSVLERQLAYWKEHLRGAPPVVSLPTDRARPPVQVFRGGLHPFTLPSTALLRFCQAEGCTLFMGLLAAFNLLLHRYSGQDDLVVGSPIANRVRPELEGMIGFFANTLPMRTRVTGEESFRQLLARVREVSLGAYAHQHLPFEKLVEELNPGRNLAYNPLFQVMLALQNTGRPLSAEGARLASGAPAMGTGTAKFDLILFVAETSESLQASLEYNSDLFDPETIAGMASHLRNLLASALATPDLPVARLSMLDPAEQAALARWNPPRTPAPDLCVHELFARQAERTPDLRAVLLGPRALTYRELDERSEALATRLRGLGAGPGVVVGICLERSLEMVVAVLAVLRSGAAYLPLDPGFPKERLAFMLTDAKVPVVLTHRGTRERLPVDLARLIDCDEEDTAPLRPIAPRAPPSPDSLAYVIFTSGSTGTPKGVAMPHRPLVNLLHWQMARSQLPLGARTLQFASLSFDVSFQELFSTWCAGGTLVLVTEEQRRDPEVLWRLLATEDIHRVFLPYVALQQLADRARELGGTPASLREVITAGEQLQITPSIAHLFSRLQATLHNQYGPSETHVVSELTLEGPPASWPALPAIGRPIPNATLHVLDRWGQQVPVGVPGELHLGGMMLARGYLGRPDATAEKFIPGPPDPSWPGERLYRTGDRARYLRDGTVQFLGRVDEQVKIRGYRVEPGEVEARLRQHPAVKEAAVTTRPDGEGRPRLVAFFQTVDARDLAANELRTWLGASLPEHMVPSAFVRMDTLPLTPTGKLNRRALPDSDEVLPATADRFVAPRTPVEEALAKLWTELLRVARVGVHDDFFELGGHSLLATRLVSRIRGELGTELPLRRVFEAPTVERLAVVIVQTRADAASEDEVALLLAELEALPAEEAQRQWAALQEEGP